MGTWKREPAIRLAGIVVLQEENCDARNLVLRLAAQSALARLKGLRLGRVARAVTHVGAGDRSEKNQENAHSRNNYKSRIGIPACPCPLEIEKWTGKNACPTIKPDASAAACCAARLLPLLLWAHERRTAWPG